MCNWHQKESRDERIACRVPHTCMIGIPAPELHSAYQNLYDTDVNVRRRTGTSKVQVILGMACAHVPMLVHVPHVALQKCELPRTPRVGSHAWPCFQYIPCDHVPMVSSFLIAPAHWERCVVHSPVPSRVVPSPEDTRARVARHLRLQASNSCCLFQLQ